MVCGSDVGYNWQDLAVLAVLTEKRLVALGAVEAAVAQHQPPSARSLKLPVSRLVSIYINSFEHFVVEMILF